ncbi:hypothetical protein HanPI659440_Chr15g0609471 [Helianthus annuus]|nr:hypothetical protein HanPI659440_Chr15g0609471 [Helianthus annuus]
MQRFVAPDGIYRTHQRCSGHRKGGYDVEVDYIMCIITSLILNCSYNISQVIFDHMVANTKDEKFLQYLRCVQMLLDDKVKNLEKDEKDELVLEHITNETLQRLQVYKNKKDTPPARRKFASITNPNYVALLENKWRHENSDSGNENEKELFENKRSKWFWKDIEKKRRRRTTPKQKPVQTQLVDEPTDDEAQHEENVETGDVGPSDVNTTQEIEDLVIGGKENVENVQGDVSVGGERVEGIVKSDSESTERDIPMTKIAPSRHDPKAKWQKKKGKASKKRKDSDEDDATYEP